MKWLHTTWRSFFYALSGLRTVAREERNFKIELFAGVVVAILAWFAHVGFAQFVAITLVIGFVLSAEIINTVIEDLCNKVQPAHDEDIRRIKDMMAGYVLVVVLVSLCIASGIFLYGNK